MARTPAPGVRPLTHLGTLPVAEFMRSTWQRRPRLFRGALGGAVHGAPDGTSRGAPHAPASPIGRDALFALAARGEVESRLVTHFNGRWRLAHGPFTSNELPSPRRAGWTLLVQGVDLHHRPAAQLRERFRFIADARLDDVMVSWASDGGGVGPHIDSYDVFLLQAQGRRRWRISRQRDHDLVPGLPLRILADFRPTQEWVLEPGDLLYLPPGVAHEGSALGADCITCSVGFRAPAWRELLDPWFEAIAARAMLDGRYRDPGLRATAHPGRLPEPMIEAAAAALARVQPTRDDAARALLALLSEPKPMVSFAPPARPPAPAVFARRIGAAGVHLDPKTRMLHSGRALAINGELHAPPPVALPPLRTLADRRALPAATCATLCTEALALLHDWHAAGWLHAGAQPR